MGTLALEDPETNYTRQDEPDMNSLARSLETHSVLCSVESLASIKLQRDRKRTAEDSGRQKDALRGSRDIKNIVEPSMSQ